jgi:hypothetical protein
MLIQGYAGRASVTAGEPIEIHIRLTGTSGTAVAADLAVYRCPAAPVRGEPATAETPSYLPPTTLEVTFQHTPSDAFANGCGWPSYTIETLPTWPSGLYVVRVGMPPGPAADIYFVLKRSAQAHESAVLVQLPFTTVHAYNDWGGHSLYHGRVAGVVTGAEDDPSHDFPQPVAKGESTLPQATRVSLHRPAPFHIWDTDDMFFGAIRHLIVWLERHADEIGSVDYISGIDLDGGYALNPYTLLISAGHDEYWSQQMWTNVMSFVIDGGNAAFLSGNTCYWRVTFDDDYSAMSCAKDPADSWFGDDLRLTGIRFPFADYPGVTFKTDPLTPFVVRKRAHWAMEDVPNCFGIRNDGISVVGYEIDSVRYISDDSGTRSVVTDSSRPRGAAINFEILATARYAVECPQLDAVLGMFRRNGTVFSVGTTGWCRGLLERGSGVDKLTENVVIRLARPKTTIERALTDVYGYFAPLPDGQKYLYSTRPDEDGWNGVGAAFRAFQHSVDGTGVVPVYSYLMNVPLWGTVQRLSLKPSIEGIAGVVAFYAYPLATLDAVAVYEFAYVIGDKARYLYQSSAAPGWAQQSVAFAVPV